MYVLLFTVLAGTATAAITFNVPSAPPANASSQLNAAPVGVSLEFFAFPGYMNDVPATKTCLQNLHDLTGAWPPMRIGGTTQDRATYDASSSNAVTYSVANAGDAPSSLTFGPSFMTLANSYGGGKIIGLNRRLNNQTNTIAAATRAKSSITNLLSLELGNEPTFYTSSDPIAGGSWSASKDYSSQVSWQSAVGSALGTTNLVSAGVYFGTSAPNIQGLAAAEGSAIQYVKDFSSHNYPQGGNGNLPTLMSHSSIHSQVAQFAAEIGAAHGQGKPHIMGETNSATQGGGGISPTFGAALWVMDYVMQLQLLGSKIQYFHQGTIGNCQYCWWGRYSMGAPYYGAYFVTMALAGAEKISALDTGSTNYAGYAIYQGNKPIRVLLYNSDYYTSGTRSSQTFTLIGLTGTSKTAKRLTAASATSRVDQGSSPSVGGQTFVDGTCAIAGTAVAETMTVSGGSATFTVAASEALLITL